MTGIIMRKELRFAAIPLIAGATIALTATSVWAFSQQTVTPNGTYNFNYSNPDDKAKLGDSANKPAFDSSNFHFTIEPTQTSPFGFHGFGGSNNAAPPDLYTPHGGGN
jgi:hypothetical protein